MDRAAERALDGYARLYALLAVTVLVVSAQPVFADVVARESGNDEIRPRPSLWVDLVDGMVSHQAVIGLYALLFAVLVGLLTAGALGGRSTGVAVGIAAAAALLSVLLIARAGFDESPVLTGWGQTAVVVAIATTALALVHRLHLWAAVTRSSS